MHEIMSKEAYIISVIWLSSKKIVSENDRAKLETTELGFLCALQMNELE